MDQLNRLADYKASDWLIPEINLSILLDSKITCRSSNETKTTNQHNPDTANFNLTSNYNHRLHQESQNSSEYESSTCSTVVTAKYSVELNPANNPIPSRSTKEQPSLPPLILDRSPDLKLLHLTVDGLPLDINQLKVVENKIYLELSSTKVEVVVVTQLWPHENHSCEGLYCSSGVVLTQMEAMGFRRFTYFIDRPDVLSIYKVRITALKSKFPVLLSNGNLVEKNELEDGRHSVTYFDPWPKPSYLFALVAGDLECIQTDYVTNSGRKVVLKIFGTSRQIPRLNWALECLIKAFRFEEDYYRFEYDLDEFNIVAVSDFNAGAMENKSLNIFNDRLLVGDLRSATDSRLLNIDRVIAHEYLHNRTGNRITCKSWFELTLKEGLTVYRDQIYSSQTGNHLIQRIEQVKDLRNQQFPEDLGSHRHPIRMESIQSIDNFYTATVYEKGAEVIRMGALIIGEELFKVGLQKYFELFDGQAVTCEDFWFAMKEVSGYNFDKFFRWYYQGGLTTIIISDNYDPDLQKYSLRIKQDLSKVCSERGSVLPFEMPLIVGLIDQLGKSIEIEAGKNSKLFIINEEESVIEIEGISSKPLAPSILRGFSAPVIVAYPYSIDQLIALLRHDEDSFNRYEASTNLLKHIILDQDIQIESLLQVYEELLKSAFKSSNEQIDYHLLALLIEPPSLREISLDLDLICYQTINSQRENFIIKFSTELNQILWRLFEELKEESNQSSDSELCSIKNIGCRALMKVLLGYLHRTDQKKVNLAAIDLILKARTMSDELNGFNILTRNYSDESKVAKATFAERWSNYDDIMPDWILGQVINYSPYYSNEPSLFSVASDLLSSPYYKKNNPNYVRALYGGVSKNLAEFHNPSGDCYSFLVSGILEIANSNQLLAARIAKCFDDYPRIKKSQQSVLREHLEYLWREVDKQRDYHILREVVQGYLA